jgi:hypothetical protein
LSRLVVVIVVGGGIAAWVLRARYDRGTAARRVATGVAVALSLVGLAGVGFAVFVMIALNSWASNK